MALDRKRPSSFRLFVIGVSIALLANRGEGFFLNTEPKTTTTTYLDEDTSIESGDLDEQAAYGLEPQIISGDRCSTACTNSQQKFSYLEGNVYQYRYEGDLKTFVTKSEFTGVKVTATASVEVIGGCDFVLKLGDVTLEDFDPINEKSDHSPSSSYFKRALEANPLSFAFDDGVITSICPARSDEAWIVNIKRSVLSHFQNTMPSLGKSATTEEVDISGVCQTSYEVFPSFVKKSKNLNKCTDSYFGKSLLQGVEYRAKSGALPILKGSQECRQEFSSANHLTLSSCKEEFVFRPLEGKVSGASTSVQTRLTFLSSHRQAIQTSLYGIDRTSSSLLFDHTLSEDEISESFSEAQETLRVLQQESTVTPSTPELFNKFSKQLKKLDYEKLNRIHASARTERAKSFIYDALPLLETGAALKAMRDFFPSVDSTRKSIWLNSFAFIQQPAEEVLVEAKHFLELSYKEASLSVSSLVHNFLSQKNSNKNCPAVVDIFNVFLHNLGSECRFRNPEEEQRILKTLKAIGNAGHSAQVVGALESCARNADLPMVMRVAAVDAFRRQECTEENARFLEEILNNQELDSELRIVAYIQRSKCFNEEFLDYIKTVLDNEQVNQVGSFIWTHLTNLAESKNPLKREISKLLKEVDTFKRFDLAENKFSRNAEWSYYHEKSNVGGTVESSLIWSQNSFVPRSLALNFSVELFGKSINLIEFGTRVQGIESLLERTLTKLPKESTGQVPDAGQAFDSQFQRKQDETTFGLYIRVFGNELVSEQLNSGLDVEGMRERFNYLNWLIDLAQERQVEFTRSFKILDSSLSLPTLLGLPLKLSVEGMATVTLQAKGKLDVLRFMSSPSNLEIGGYFKPSSSVVISGEMGIDSKLIKQGLKMVSTLFSKVVVDGKMELKDGSSFSFDWNTPEDRTDVFSMESRFFVVHRGRSIEKSDENRNALSELRCLDDSYASPLGMKPCLEYSFNDLEGVRELDISSYTPAYIRLYLEKTDTHTGYHLSTSYSKTETTSALHFKVDTPQSRVDRKISLDFQMERGNLNVQLYSPWKKLNLQSQIALFEQLRKVDALLVVDDMARYEFKFEIANNTNQQRELYNYKFEMVMPQIPVITLHGILKKNERRVEFTANLMDVFHQPVVLNLNYNHNSRLKKYELITTLASHIFQLNLKTSVEHKQPGHYSWNALTMVSYTLLNRPTQTASVLFKINDDSTSNLKSFQVEGSTEFTEFPQLTAQTLLDLEYSATTLRSKLELKHQGVRKAFIAQTGILDFNSPRQRFNGKLQVEIPSKQWDWQAEYDHIQSDTQLSSNTSVVVYGRKEFFVNVGMRKSQPIGPLSVEGDLEIGLPRGYAFRASETLREGVGPNYRFTLDGQLVTPRFTKSGRFEGVYRLADMSRHELDVKSQIEGFKPFEISGHLNPNPQNVQFRVGAVYDGETYAIGGKYVFRGNSYERYNAELSAEVFYPSAKHGLEVSVARRSMEFSGHVAVLLTEQISYKLSSSVTAVSYTPTFSAKVEWPGNYFELSTLGKYSRTGWMTSSGELQGQIAVKSSIPGMEELSGTFHASQDHVRTRSMATLSWSPSKKIVADVKFELFKVQIDVSTPFEGYTEMKFLSQTDVTERSLVQKIVASLGSQFVSVVIDGDANSLPNFEGKVTLTSSFRGFERITFGVKNAISGLDIHSSAELDFSNSRKIVLTLISKNEITYQSFANEGSLTLETFFRNLEHQYFKWDRKLNSTSIVSRYEALVYEKKYQLNVDGSTSLHGNQIEVLGNLEFKTPHAGLSNFGMNVNYKLLTDSYVGEGMVRGYLEHQRITVQQNLQFLPGEALVFKLSIGTPFRGYERLEIDLNNRFDGSKYHAANEVDLGLLGRGTLGGSLAFASGHLDASVQLTTSSRLVEHASLSLKFDEENNQQTTRLDFDYNNGVAFVSTEVRTVFVGREKKFDVDINTSWSEWRTFKFASSAVGGPKHLKLSASVEHNELPGRFASAFTYDVRDPKKLVLLQYTLTTPNAYLNTFKAELKYNFQSQHNKYIMHGFYEVNHDSHVGLSGEVIYNSWQDFSTTTKMRIDNEIAVLSTSAAYSDDSHLFSATFTAPYPVENSASFKFQRTGPWNKFLSEIFMELNDKNVKLDTDFELGEESNLSISKKLDVNGVRKFSLNFQHTPTYFPYGSGWTNEGHVELNGVHYRINSELSWPERKELLLKAYVSFPSQYGFGLHHKGDYSDMETSLDVKVADETYRNKLVFKNPDSETIQLKFNLDAPEGSMDDFELSFDHQGSFEKFVTNAHSTPIFGIQFSFNAQYDASQHKAKSELKITTPIRGLGLTAFNLDHVGPWNNFNTELTSEIAGKSYKNVLSFVFEGSDRIVFKTTHSGSENVAFEFTVNSETNAVKSGAILTTSIRGYERFSFESTLQTISHQSLVFNGKLITWFDSLPEMDVLVEYRAPSPMDVYALLKLDIPSGTISVNFQGGDISHSLLVLTPFSGYERMLYKVQSRTWFEGSQKHESVEVEVETPFRGYERTYFVMKNVYEEGNTIVTMTRRMETSNPDVKFIDQYYHHNLDINRAAVIYTMTSGYVHFSRLHASVNFVKTRFGFKVDSILETSFDVLPEVKVNFDVSGSRGLYFASYAGKYALYSDTFIIDGSNGVLVSNEFVQTDRRFNEDDRRILTKFDLKKESDNQFGVVVQASTPFVKLTELLLQLKFRASPSSIGSGVTLDFTTDRQPFRASTGLDLVLNSIQDHKILLTFESPLVAARQFSLGYGVDLTGDEHLAKFEVKLNDAKLVDVDYKRQVAGGNLIAVNIRSPYQAGSTLNMDGNSGALVVDWDTTRHDRNVRFVFDLKNEESSGSTERSLNLTVITVYGTAGFGIGYRIDPNSFSHSLRLYGSEDLETPDFSYLLKGSFRPNVPFSYVADGSFTVVTEEINHSVGFVHTVAVNQQFTTQLYSDDRLTRRRIALNSDLVLSFSSFKHVASFEHPDFPKEILSVVEASSSRAGLEWKHSVRLNDEVFTIEAVLEEAPSSNPERGAGQITSGLRFHHPTSNTDVQLKMTLRSVEFVYSFDAEVLYKLSRTSQMKKFSFESRYDCVRHDVLLKVDTPVKSTELRGTSHELDFDNGVVSYEVSMSSQDLFQVKSVVNFNLPSRDIDVKLFPSQYKYYQIEGHLKGIGEASVKLNKFEDVEENAVSLGWSVNDRNFLVLRSFIKPRFWEQWRAAADQNLHHFLQRSRSVAAEWDDLRLELSEDGRTKAERFRLAVEPYARVMEVWRAALSRSYEEFLGELERMYRENVYNLRDIVDGLRAVSSQMRHCFRRSLEITSAALHELGRKIGASMKVLLGQVLGLLREAAEKLRVLEPHFRNLAIKIDSAFSDLNNRISALLYEILSQPEVREFMEKLRQLPSLTWAELREKFWSAADALLSNEVVKKAIGCLADFIEKYKSVYGLVYSTERVSDFVGGLRALTSDHFASEKVRHALERYLKLSENRWTVWEPETGNYEYQLFVPPRLQQWIDFLLNIDYQAIAGSMGKVFGKIMDELRDMTAFIEEMYSYDFNKLMDLVPPFRSTASLTGPQHFRTFDGRSFQYSSTCSHLLSRDFVDRSFSAFVNFDTRRGHIVKKSITVFTDGRKFDIIRDGRVLVDDGRVELPTHFENTHVVRVGENEVHLISERGFKLVCDIVHDHCSFTASGWYHGKLAGLFGNKNFEKADDFLTSDGLQRVEEVERFASSWATPAQCGTENMAVFKQHATTSNAYEACHSTFNSSQSPLSPCFRHVDPTDFFHMCLNEVPATESVGRIAEGACRISAAYQRECTGQSGLHVRMPKHCVKCSSQEVDHWEGDIFRLNVAADTKAADLVFVIQNGRCNKRVFDRIRSLTEELQKALHDSEDIRLTRYALVSYGGEFVVPRLHTMDGRVFNAFDKVQRVNFDSESSTVGVTDGMAAIQFAAKLPFRTGASKSIIFIPCQPCLGAAGLHYPEVHRMIIQSDIKFHVLLPEPIRVKSSSSHTKSAFIFGFDDTKVYSKRDVIGELDGDTSLRTFTRVPKDFCAALTHDTSGVVFSSRQWFDTPNQVQKSFVDVFARLVAKKAQPTQCQECTCLADSVGSGFTHCVSCVRRSYFSWINDFLDDDFEDASEEVDTSGVQTQAGGSYRPVRPDSRDPQRQHTPRPQGSRASPGQGRQQRPSRPSRI